MTGLFPFYWPSSRHNPVSKRGGSGVSTLRSAGRFALLFSRVIILLGLLGLILPRLLGQIARALFPENVP